ncbi:TetR/AcrR family transcriptional regulator [Actinoplanes sp. NBC_00393]|uniref:TetR/AcrR family transcriptional regulator n=1 Tax=Actinoplanes sp. NBC_00393 TaxID=2975953 RepID=UPI002E208E6D
MGRVSQAQAAQNRSRIVTTAARLFRERGVAGVSVADVMAEAGLTHGGFYKHFASKDALVAEAVTQAFAEQAAALDSPGSGPSGRQPGAGEADDQRAGGPEAGGPEAFLDAYLSAAHRDRPGTGCPSAGFGGDIARAAGGEETRRAYAAGVEGFARRLAAGGEADLAAVSTMVGALLLSRATAGTDLSDRILAAARDALTHRDGRGPARADGVSSAEGRSAAGSAPSPAAGNRPV